MNYDLEMTYEPTELEMELRASINKHSRENESDTPDYILAEMMINCLKAFERATIMRYLSQEDDRQAMKGALEAIIAVEEDSPAAFRAARLIAKETLGTDGA